MDAGANVDPRSDLDACRIADAVTDSGTQHFDADANAERADKYRDCDAFAGWTDADVHADFERRYLHSGLDEHAHADTRTRHADDNIRSARHIAAAEHRHAHDTADADL